MRRLTSMTHEALTRICNVVAMMRMTHKRLTRVCRLMTHRGITKVFSVVAMIRVKRQSTSDLPAIQHENLFIRRPTLTDPRPSRANDYPHRRLLPFPFGNVSSISPSLFCYFFLLSTPTSHFLCLCIPTYRHVLDHNYEKHITSSFSTQEIKY